MMNRLEELWDSADDGASTPIGPLVVHDDAEFDELLDAWYIERQYSIECEILLEQSRALIGRLLGESDASPARRKQARRLIRAIDLALRAIDARGD